MDTLSDERLLILREKVEAECLERGIEVEVVLHNLGHYHNCKNFIIPEEVVQEMSRILSMNLLSTTPLDHTYVEAVKKWNGEGLTVRQVSIPLGSTLLIYKSAKAFVHKMRLIEWSGKWVEYEGPEIVTVHD